MADAHGGLTATVSKPTVKLLSTPSNTSAINGPTTMTAISQPNEDNISSTAVTKNATVEPSASANLNTKSAPGSDDTVQPKTVAESHSANEKGTESESDGDDAEEILEESPCKRWSKRREKVKQRDVPGIDFAFLAMDNETGNEVVWNEVQFSERKNFRAQEEKINAVFDNLTMLIHPNLVKFHKYWTDAKSEKPRIIFITEYMSSGPMSRFLTRTRKSNSSMSIKAWKKWCTQILSALNYLHSCDPPIVHGNLSCTTIFIQTNGLIKIGCVAPNAIHHHVKTFRENMKNMHYIAPEYELCTTVTPAADIYSFGICALEMAVAGGFGTNSDGSTPVVTPDLIKKSLESVDDPLQRNFIEICLAKDPEQRPTARELLFHRILFEVHSLKLLSAHALVSSEIYEALSEDKIRLKGVDMDKAALLKSASDASAPSDCSSYVDPPSKATVFVSEPQS
uniref:Protein kinase domain-containing protein n=1 Tax=Plectus sambesii TaxID=2011161 RepID=A0A914VYF5_9BILA